MKVICAWCKKDMGTKNGAPGTHNDVSHGICPECKARVQEEIRQQIALR